MATQAIAGRRGFIGFNATSSGTPLEVAEVTDYALTVEAEQADASSFDSSGWNEVFPVTRQWQLEYSIVATSGNYSTALNGWKYAISRTAKRWLTLYPSTSSTGVRWRGYALLESAELSGDMGNVIQADFVWQGHRALLYSTG